MALPDRIEFITTAGPTSFGEWSCFRTWYAQTMCTFFTLYFPLSKVKSLTTLWDILAGAPLLQLKKGIRLLMERITPIFARIAPMISEGVDDIPHPPPIYPSSLPHLYPLAFTSPLKSIYLRVGRNLYSSPWRNFQGDSGR